MVPKTIFPIRATEETKGHTAIPSPQLQANERKCIFGQSSVQQQLHQQQRQQELEKDNHFGSFCFLIFLGTKFCKKEIVLNNCYRWETEKDDNDDDDDDEDDNDDDYYYDSDEGNGDRGYPLGIHR